jgi:hypothetical protein
MPAAAIAAPVVAVGFAAYSAATVGFTLATVMATTAAVGATLGAIGHFTNSKELQIAGTVLGVVGGVGALASSAGLFGTAAGLAEAGTAAASAGQVATDVAPLAAEGINAVAGPAGGYTLETLNNAIPGALAGFEGVTPGMSNIDIIDMVNGVGVENFNALAPAEQLTAAQSANPAANVLPDTTAAAAPAEEVLPELAQTYTPESGAPPGLIDSAQAQVGIDGLPRDQYGNLIAQGDADPTGGQLGAGVSNPADPNATPAADPNAVGAQPPAGGTGMAGTEPAPGTIQTPSATTTTQVTGQPQPLPGEPAGGTPAAPTGAPTPATPAAGTTAAQQAADKIIYGPVTGGISKASVFGKIMNLIEDKPVLGLGVLMGASSFISGAFAPGMNAEQRAAYAAQAEQNLAAANLARAQEAILQRRLRNMQDPIPRMQPGPPPGLINSPVTGRPA